METHFALFSIFTSLLALGSGLVGYIRSANRKLAGIWGITSLAIFFWSLGLGLMVLSKTQEEALFWMRYVHYIGAIFIPGTFFHFITIFLKYEQRYKKIIWANYLASMFFIVANLSGVLCGIKNTRWFQFYTAPFPLYHSYTLFFAIVVGFSVFLLIRSINKEKGIRRNQIKYILLATIIGFSGGSTAFFPVYQLNIYPVGMYIVFIYPFLIVYAMVKYRLMEIELVVKRWLVDGILTVVLWIILLALTEINIPVIFRIISIGVISYMIVRIVPDLIIKLEDVVGGFIYKDKYKYVPVLSEYIKSIPFIVGKDKLVNRTIDLVNREMDLVKSGIVFISSNVSDYYMGMKEEEYGILKTVLGNQLIAKSESPILLEEDANYGNLHVGIEKLNDLGIRLLIPIFLKDLLIGWIILGEKRRGDMYSQVDLELLQTLAKQMAIALDYKEMEENLRNQQIYGEVTRKRLKAIQSMAYGLADRLNNYLMGAYNFFDMFSNWKDKIKDALGEDGERFLKMWEYSKIGVEEMVHLSGEITRLCETRPLEMKKYNPEVILEIVDEVVDELRNKIKEKNIEVGKELDEKTPATYFDREVVRFVLRHLIENSIHAIPSAGGRIRIKVRVLSEGEDRRRYIGILVEDNGVGIDKEMVDNIFNPFFTTKGTSGGYGLGLLTSQFAVVQMGGQIRIVWTKENEGTGIEFTIPVKDELFPH